MHSWGVTIWFPHNLLTQCWTAKTRQASLTLKSVFFNAKGVGKYAAGYDWGSSGRLCASQFGVRWDFPLAAFTHSSSKLAVHVNTKEGREECRRWMLTERRESGYETRVMGGRGKTEMMACGAKTSEVMRSLFSCVRLCSRWLFF